MRSLVRDPNLHIAALAGAILLTGCAPPPGASEPPQATLAVDQVAGFWNLRGKDGARCDLSLANLVIDGVRPVLAERCRIPAATTAKTWRSTAGGFELLAADGSVAMAFRHTGEDGFESVEGGFRLSRAPIS